MKTRIQPGANPRRAVLSERGAFTLVELMVTVAVFSLVVIGMVYAHLFALQEDELVNSKLGASDESRLAFNEMTAEIRSSKSWRVGTGSEDGFVPVPNGNDQVGNALQLHLTTDTNDYILYYFDTNAGELCRAVSGVDGSRVVAQYLTNQMTFRAEDYLGNLKTDLSYKYVIHLVMEHQYQYPLTKVGPGYYYNYYKLEFKVTPHCPDGA